MVALSLNPAGNLTLISPQLMAVFPAGRKAESGQRMQEIAAQFLALRLPIVSMGDPP